MSRPVAWMVAAFVGLAAARAAGQSDRVVRVLEAAPGTAVSVEITVGDVLVSGWNRSQIEVAIVRRADDAARLAAVAALVDRTADGVRVRAVQDGGGRDARIRTDVEIRVPTQTRLEDIVVFEGRVEVAGVSGPCAARVERGTILARDTSGALRLETVLGDIRVKRGSLSPDGPVRLRTFNGSIGLELTAVPQDARILALSMGGAIASDIPLTLKTGWGPRFGETSLGKGEPLVSLDAVNGDVAIRVRR